MFNRIVAACVTTFAALALATPSATAAITPAHDSTTPAQTNQLA